MWITSAVVLVHAVMFVHAVRAVMHYAVWAVHAVRALHAVMGVNTVNFFITLGPAKYLGTLTINYNLFQTSFHCHFQSKQKAKVFILSTLLYPCLIYVCKTRRSPNKSTHKMYTTSVCNNNNRKNNENRL